MFPASNHSVYIVEKFISTSTSHNGRDPIISEGMSAECHSKRIGERGMAGPWSNVSWTIHWLVRTAKEVEEGGLFLYMPPWFLADKGGGQTGFPIESSRREMIGWRDGSEVCRVDTLTEPVPAKPRWPGSSWVWRPGVDCNPSTGVLWVIQFVLSKNN